MAKLKMYSLDYFGSSISRRSPVAKIRSVRSSKPSQSAPITIKKTTGIKTNNEYQDAVFCYQREQKGCLEREDYESLKFLEEWFRRVYQVAPTSADYGEDVMLYAQEATRWVRAMKRLLKEGKHPHCDRQALKHVNISALPPDQETVNEHQIMLSYVKKYERALNQHNKKLYSKNIGSKLLR